MSPSNNLRMEDFIFPLLKSKMKRIKILFIEMEIVSSIHSILTDDSFHFLVKGKEKINLPFKKCKFSVDHHRGRVYVLLDRDFYIISFGGKILFSSTLKINPEMYCDVCNCKDYISIHYYRVHQYRRYDEVFVFNKKTFEKYKLEHIYNFFFCSTSLTQENVVYTFSNNGACTMIKKINLDSESGEEITLPKIHFFLYEKNNIFYTFCENRILSSLFSEDGKRESILFEGVYSFYKGVISPKINSILSKDGKYLLFSFFADGKWKVFAYDVISLHHLLLFERNERVDHLSQKEISLNEKTVDTIIVINQKEGYTLSTGEWIENFSLLPTAKQLLFPYYEEERGLVEILYNNC